MKPFKITLAFAIIIFLAGKIFCDEKSEEVDKLFVNWDTTVSPGAALAIIKDGKIIYKRGYGMAKLEDNIVMTPSKIFDIGSVSKQFTAACIAILVKEGKISLDDDIRKYIPEMPKYQRPITIRHLIHHTSGLRDYNALLSFAGFRPDSDCPTVEEALKIITSQKKLNFAPGEEYSYSNTGYFLMGLIVERVSGKTLNEFAQENIFKPLGMKNTLFQDDHTQIIKNRASGYSPSEGGYKFNMSNWDEVGDGNVYTSVEDLYLWDQAFYNHKLGKDLMEMLHTVGELNNGKKIKYAFGLVIDEYKGLRVVQHGGAWAGFRAGFVRFPEEKFSVICLANLSTINPSNLCFKIADIYLADKIRVNEEKKEEPTPITLSQRELEEKVGNYEEEKYGIWITLSVEEGRLKMNVYGQEFILVPLSPSRFKTLNAPLDISVDFLPQKKGHPLKAILKLREGEEFNLIRAEPLGNLTPEKLKEYEGEYMSEELLNSIYKFFVEKEELLLRFRTAPKEPLKPMAPDKFVLGEMSFTFTRDNKGKIKGLKLSTARVSGIKFLKK